MYLAALDTEDVQQSGRRPMNTTGWILLGALLFALAVSSSAWLRGSLA
jgi:hypothetical protein